MAWTSTTCRRPLDRLIEYGREKCLPRPTWDVPFEFWSDDLTTVELVVWINIRIIASDGSKSISLGD
jgi:hypothetical protein